MGASFGHPGLTDIEMETKSASTVEGIDALYKEIDDMRSNASTPAELKRAKDQILNSFIFRFDTPEKVLREKMLYEFYHYPLDFLEQYRSQVEKVTADDVTASPRNICTRKIWRCLWSATPKEFGTPLSGLDSWRPRSICRCLPPQKELMEQMGMQGPGQP